MWGYNVCGQLGDGTTGDKSSPVKVMEGVKSVSLGMYHSAAVKTDGSLWTWGYNVCGQLGDGTTEDKSRPAKALEGVKSVSLCWHQSAALKTDGSLWMWGDNDYGQLGDGTTEDKSSPVKTLEGVKSASLGYYHGAVVKTDGSLWMWGRNDYGQLGDGTTQDKSRPVKALEGVESASLGGHHSAALKTDGSLWMWGWNIWGQLGDGTAAKRYEPVKIMDLEMAITPEPSETPAPGAYTVTFDANGGTVSPSGKTVTNGSAYGELPVPTRKWTGETYGYEELENYRFDGWYTSRNGGVKITSDSVAELTADQTLYAHWSCTVTFSANGGDVSPSSKTVFYEDVYGTLPTPTWAGHSFVGWYTKESGGTQIASGSTVQTTWDISASTQNLYAHWTPETRYLTAYLDVNGGNKMSALFSRISVIYDSTYGNNVIFRSMPDPTREGYTFDGWYTAKTGGAKITKKSIVQIAEDHTLYAHWTSASKSYTVTFNANGGTVSPTSKTVTYGEKYGELPEPKWEGHDFNGWHTSKTGGTEITGASAVELTSDQTLYAHWIEEEVPKRDIRNADITLSQEKYTYDGSAKKPSVTVKLNGVTLKENTDYTVAYSDNTKVGAAKVTVTGKGSYTGSAQKTFTIQEALKTSIAKATVTLSPESYAYDGAAKKPAVTVKLNGKTLKQNTDYTVAYSNNKNVGVAKATVTGKGSYTGTVTRTFSIVAKTKAFAWGKDNWNYNNSSSQKYFSSGKYIDQINSAYLNKLKKSLTNSEYQAIFNKSRGWIYDRFSGSCYGMSSTALLAKRGYLPYTQYKSGASSLYQLNYPLADMKVSSLVTYYQMLQVKGVIQQQYRTLPTKSHKENIQKILSLLDANPTVLVGFRKDGWGGHAVLAYGYDYGSFTWNGVSYQGRIKICDPNSSRRTSDDSKCHIYFNTKTYNWEIPYYSRASIKSSSGAKFNYVGASVNEINSGGYLSGTDKNGISDYVARIDAAAISRNRTVIKMLEQNGSYIPNHAASDDIVEDYSYILGGEGGGTIGYNLYDAESSYKISQEDPVKLQLSIDYGDCFLEGGSMAGKNVIFDKDGYVSVAGESADFNIAMTFNEDYPTDWFTMTVKGKNSDEASLQKVEDGYILEGENLEKIDVEANNREDSVHASFSTSYPSAYICEIDENTVGVKVDKDNNGSYETLIAKGSGEKPQAPVSIEKAKISGIKTAYTYTGKKQTPKPVVKAAGKNLRNGTDYTVSYKNNQNVGTATVTIKGKGGYAGTKSATFKINPKGTSLGKLTGGKKRITVKWKKQAAQTTGYEIQASASKKFAKGTTKLTTVKKAAAVSTAVTKLKAKTRYYVRIRTYKTVSGKKYYSGWSKVMNVKTK